MKDAHKGNLDNIESKYWDVIVIGTGMGGATTGYELAKAKKNVLFIEKGNNLLEPQARKHAYDFFNKPSKNILNRLKQGLWPTKLKGRTSFGATEFFAPLGCGSGGSANLYAAQLERMLPSDFEPKKNFPNYPEANLPESWPISYEEFIPYYRKAEILYRVRGTQDPLYTDKKAFLRSPPELSLKDKLLYNILKKSGLHPYRAHVANEYYEECSNCGGTFCSLKCKNDAATICLEPALRDYRATLMADCEVIRLEADHLNVKGVIAMYKNREVFLRGKTIVLAAGALHTPEILLNSRSKLWPNGLANSSDLVGRNLMWHASDFIGLFPLKLMRADRSGPKKAFSINDFYLSSHGKLGTIQSAGVPISKDYVLSFLINTIGKRPKWQQTIAKLLPLNLIAKLAEFFFQNTSLFATVIEDLPYLRNRVKLNNKEGGMYFEYDYSDELMQRSKLLFEKIKHLLKKNFIVFKVTGKNNINFGHACGTCRFGNDPMSSILNANNRCHDLENLYITDSSFFPSSGGTNPSLTIAANAIRVAEIISRGSNDLEK